MLCCISYTLFKIKLPHNPDFYINPDKRSLQKTLLENEKILVTSIFSFSPQIFLFLLKTNLKFLDTFISLSANLFNLG